MDNESRARIIQALSKSVEKLSLSSYTGAGIKMEKTIEVLLERIQWLGREIS